MPSDQFIDPAGVRSSYSWDVSHTEEEAFGRERSIERTANTDNTGLVRQQGDTGPLLIRWTGTILKKAQHDEMVAWFELCDSQTIYLHDFAGNEYEVIITSFLPLRKRASANRRGGSSNPLHYWSYTIEFDVIGVRSGDWIGASP